MWWWTARKANLAVVFSFPAFFSLCLLLFRTEGAWSEVGA